MSVNRPEKEEDYRLSAVPISNTKDEASTAASLRLKPSRLAIFASRQPEHRINSFCGAVAGAASGIVTCPLDVIKTKLQGQGGFRPLGATRSNIGPGPSYRGLVGTASVIWTQDGLRGMYRGLGPMLLGYLPTWAVYMTVYGGARDYYYTRLGENLFLESLQYQLTLTTAKTTNG